MDNKSVKSKKETNVGSESKCAPMSKFAESDLKAGACTLVGMLLRSRNCPNQQEGLEVRPKFCPAQQTYPAKRLSPPFSPLKISGYRASLVGEGLFLHGDQHSSVVEGQR